MPNYDRLARSYSSLLYSRLPNMLNMPTESAGVLQPAAVVSAISEILNCNIEKDLIFEVRPEAWGTL